MLSNQVPGAFKDMNVSVDVQAFEAAGEAGEHASVRLLYPLLLIGLEYFGFNQPVSIVFLHVLPLFLVKLFYWGEGTAVILSKLKSILFR